MQRTSLNKDPTNCTRYEISISIHIINQDVGVEFLKNWYIFTTQLKIPFNAAKWVGFPRCRHQLQHGIVAGRIPHQLGQLLHRRRGPSETGDALGVLAGGYTAWNLLILYGQPMDEILLNSQLGDAWGGTFFIDIFWGDCYYSKVLMCWKSPKSIQINRDNCCQASAARFTKAPQE